MKLIKGIYNKLELKPDFRPFPFYFMKILNGFYVRFVEGVSSINIDGTGSLAKALSDFQKGNSRLIVTFRHPTRHDPPILMRVVHTLIPREAKKSGIRLNRITHGHFVYGKWLMIWANSMARWLFPGIGAIPVNNRSRDLEGIRTIREVLKSGRFPLFIAPEGQVTYHNESCAPLEGGVSSMAQWCREDMDRTNSATRVEILPISLHYDYSVNGEKGFIKVIERVKKELNSTSNDLIELTNNLLERIEDYYSNFHFSKIENSDTLEERIKILVDTILNRAERYFNIDPKGNFLDRTLTIRQLGLSNIDFSDRLKELPGREHGDHLANECYSILRHMEIGDLLQYIDPSYIENETLNRRIEYGLNLLDLINRFNGGTIASRFSGLKMSVCVKAGDPIVVKSSSSRKEKREEGERLLNEIYYGLHSLSTSL